MYDSGGQMTLRQQRDAVGSEGNSKDQFVYSGARPAFWSREGQRIREVQLRDLFWLRENALDGQRRLVVVVWVSAGTQGGKKFFSVADVCTWRGEIVLEMASTVEAEVLSYEIGVAETSKAQAFLAEYVSCLPENVRPNADVSEAVESLVEMYGGGPRYPYRM